MSKLKDILISTATTGLIALAGCGINPELQEVKDLNNDGIPDISIKATGEDFYKKDWIFLSQKDGSYIRCKDWGAYIESDSGEIYFWDGHNYIKAYSKEK